MMHHIMNFFYVKGAKTHVNVAPHQEEPRSSAYRCLLPSSAQQVRFGLPSSPNCLHYCCFGVWYVVGSHVLRGHKAIKNCFSWAQCLGYVSGQLLVDWINA